MKNLLPLAATALAFDGVAQVANPSSFDWKQLAWAAASAIIATAVELLRRWLTAPPPPASPGTPGGGVENP